MEKAIAEIERLCQEKILLFQDLLSVIKEEKKTIIKADVGALWKYTDRKNEIGNKIQAIREEIKAIAIEAEFLDSDDNREYSLMRIISALPRHEKTSLLNIRFTLVGIKTKITAIAHENKRYLNESLKTIEDLISIITQNCEKNERYGRDSYLKASINPRPKLIYGEV